MRTPPTLETVSILTGILLLSGCGGGSNSIPTPAPASPSFTISLNPSSISVSPGTSGAVTVSLQPENGFEGTATVTLSGLPSGMTVSPSSPFSLTAAGQALELTAASGVVDGTYTLSFQATSGTLSASANASLQVAPPASFSVVPSNGSLSVQYGNSVTTTISFSPGAGATNYMLQLAASNLPSGVTASFAPNPVAPTLTSTATFTTPSSATSAASDTVTITATRTSDGVQQQAQLLLNMTLPPGQLPSSRTEFVRTDDTPSSVVYDPLHKLVFACEPHLSRVDVISPVNRQIVKSIPVPGAQGLSLSVDDSRVYVGGGTERLSWIDTTSLTVVGNLTFPLVNNLFIEAPVLAALSNGKIFTPAALVDPSTGNATSITGTCSVGGVFARSADGTKIISSSDSYPSYVCLYEAATNSTSAQTQFQEFAFAVAANPNGTQFAVAVNNQGICLLDSNLNILGTAPVGGLTTGMVYSQDGSSLYIVSQPAGVPIISTVNTQTFQLTGTAPAYATNIAYFTRVPPLFIETPMAADATGLVFGAADHGVALDDSTFYETLSPSAAASVYAIVATPDEGPVDAPTPVAIETQSFSGLPNVWFGEEIGTDTFANGAGQVQSTAPPTSGPGPVNVRIFVPDGTVAMIPQAFTYGDWPVTYGTLGAAPSGGASVDLYGYGYGADVQGSALQVQMGGNKASVTHADLYPAESAFPFPLQHLQVTVPAGSPGAQNITLTSPSGSTTISKGFHYLESVQDYSTTDTLLDVVYDQSRQQLYLSAGNHVDVFSLSSNSFLPSITPPTLTGTRQLAGMALTPDDSKLLVANFGDDSVGIINPDAPSGAVAVQIVPPGTFASPVPDHIATTSLNTAFVDTSSGGIYLLDLGTLQASADNDPGLFYTYAEGTGNWISSSRDGSQAVIAAPNSTPGPFMVWTAAANKWIYRLLPSSLIDGTVSGDGNVFSAVGYGDPSFELSINFLDSQANILALAGLADFLIETATGGGVSGYLVGARLNDAGSLIYVPFPQGVDIFDVQHGDLRQRIFLTEQMTYGGSLGDLSSRIIHNLAIDQTGDWIFLLTNKGLTIAQLDSVPLSIGSVTPSLGPAGTQVKIRGSGFAQGTTGSANGTPAAVSYVDPNTLQLTLPSLPSGTVQITITNPDGQSYVLDNAFTVQ